MHAHNLFSVLLLLFFFFFFLYNVYIFHLNIVLFFFFFFVRSCLVCLKLCDLVTTFFICNTIRFFSSFQFQYYFFRSLLLILPFRCLFLLVLLFVNFLVFYFQYNLFPFVPFCLKLSTSVRMCARMFDCMLFRM